MLSERSGSALRRTKTCLRYTSNQERLNYGILSIHAGKTNLLNLALIANEFLEANIKRV